MNINKNIVKKEKNGINYIQFKPLLDLNIKHAYTLKSDNLIVKTTGYAGTINKEGYKRVCSAIELNGENVVLPKLHHTENVKCIDKVYEHEELEDIDGLITNKKDIILATTNADCILYLLYDPIKKVIGNVHSGWRGSYKRIIENAVDKMISEYQSNSEDIIICICPSIRKCCFEVDEDVKNMFTQKFSFLSNIDNFVGKGEKQGKFYIDTVGINNELLKKKGIKEKNIYDCEICSFCNKEEVHSFRAEGKNFRVATAIISL